MKQLLGLRDREWIRILWIVSVFTLSRLLFCLIGVRFDSTPLDYFWQYLDPELLRHQLLTSVHYLHIQPPLWNLLLGACVKLTPSTPSALLHFASLIVGLLLCLSLYSVLKTVGAEAKIRLILTTIFVLSPAAILFENWLMYDYFVTGTLCFSAVVLYRFLQTPRFGAGLLFFGTAAIIVLTRSVFHLAWLVLLTAAVALIIKHQWKLVLISACIPLLLCTSWYAKNLIVFGSFSSTTWMGMDLAKMIRRELPEGDVTRLVAEGKLSPISSLPAFDSLESYLPYLPAAKKTGVEALDQVRKSTGSPNYNNLAYVQVSRSYLHDMLFLMRARPMAYPRSVAHSVAAFFLPASDLCFLNANQGKIAAYDEAFSTIVYGQLVSGRQTAEKSGKVPHFGFFLVIWFVLGVFAGVRRLRSLWSEPEQDLPQLALLLYMLGNVLYVTVISSLFEIGENHRYRLMVEPFLFALIGIFLSDLVSKWMKTGRLST